MIIISHLFKINTDDDPPNYAANNINELIIADCNSDEFAVMRDK